MRTKVHRIIGARPRSVFRGRVHTRVHIGEWGMGYNRRENESIHVAFIHGWYAVIPWCGHSGE